MPVTMVYHLCRQEKKLIVNIRGKISHNYAAYLSHKQCLISNYRNHKITIKFLYCRLWLNTMFALYPTTIYGKLLP